MLQTKRIKYRYIPASVNKVEAWLQQMAKDGWQLIRVHRKNFIFRKCSPYTGSFFMYEDLDRSMGISFDYHMAKLKYGKSKSKSELNSLPCVVFEVDPQKTDPHLLLYFKQRNEHYAKHYTKVALLFACFTVAPLLISFDAIVISILFPFPVFVYACISLMILKRHK